MVTHVVIGPDVPTADRDSVAAAVLGGAAAVSSAWVRESARAGRALDHTSDEFRAALPAGTGAEGRDAAGGSVSGLFGGAGTVFPTGAGNRAGAASKSNGRYHGNGSTATIAYDSAALGAKWMVVVSRYEGVEREEVAQLAHDLGAESTDELRKNVATHLVVPVLDAVGNRKVKRAQEWGLPIVTVDWLRACVSERREVPTGAHRPPPPREAQARAPPSNNGGRLATLRARAPTEGGSGRGGSVPSQPSQRAAAGTGHASGSGPSSAPTFENHDPWSMYASQINGDANGALTAPAPPPPLPAMTSPDPGGADGAATAAARRLSAQRRSTDEVGGMLSDLATLLPAGGGNSGGRQGARAGAGEGAQQPTERANVAEGAADGDKAPKIGVGDCVDEFLPQSQLQAPPSALRRSPRARGDGGGGSGGGRGPAAEGGADAQGPYASSPSPRKRSRSGDGTKGGDNDAGGGKRRSRRRRQSSPPPPSTSFGATQADTQLIGYDAAPSINGADAELARGGRGGRGRTGGKSRGAKGGGAGQAPRKSGRALDKVRAVAELRKRRGT